ncbi:MAG TPA: hypothetical protein VE153_07750, partial [Myxococcus sp.]|nr:hypothetical protein [Myxococcus sp.]
EEGLAEVRSSIQLWKMLNVEMNHPTRMGLLAETCALAGRTDEALETIDRALDATRSGERYFEAELRRLKGELLLRLQPHRRLEAEQQFRLALDVSRQQGARTLELRAALSLARLLEQDGAVPEAREHLGVVCDWFTGNPPLPELSEARALLDRLATGSAPLRLAR